MRQQKFEAALKAIVERIEQAGEQTEDAYADLRRYHAALRNVEKLAKEALARD